MSREITARANKNVPIVVGVCVVAFFVLLAFMQQKHKTHSGGDYGVPTFSNGGKYRDGTRSADFNSNNHRAYGCGGSKSSVTGKVGQQLLVLALVVAVFVLFMRGCWSSPEHICNGSCG
ncbi:13KDa protein [Beet soil-borne mosaic virus]|uniref:13 kDa protein n=1 Tax=Beet soil-borne mosaic virus TaxID=76343 RepID=O72592_9VIRU|nr:13 kDa protein [Beet soil-borne mosaic virus]AAC18571.1 13KDa protein [Beet soil-borne mosaic virus]AEK48987.1 13 kDa protein [Beet soil-borne mosaic virus]APZ76017.1 13K protein [Beet soil-borne mosaic virus]WIW79803.1 triple gene block 2 protein [Beet soil-borne mosaic virus]